MKSFSIPIFFSIANSLMSCLAQNTQTSQPPGLSGVVDSEKAKQLIHYWADYACFTLSDQSEPNVKQQCKKACFPGGVTSDVPPGSLVESSQTCWLNGPESDYLTGKELTEDQKKENPRTFKSIRTGYCTCNDPIINIAGDFFIKSVNEAGKILTKVMCPTLLALDIVVEIGSAAIPGVGKAITVGMRTGIKTAKMFKHGYEAEEAATEWASMFVDQGFGLASEAGCKTPFKFSKADLAKRFVDFSDAPDELVPGINYDTMPCPKGKKASKKCRDRNGEQDSDESASKTKDSAKSTSASVVSSVVSSIVSSSATPLPTADCAAIGRRDTEALQEEYPSLEDGIGGQESTGVELRSPHLQPRYRPKTGQACSRNSLTFGYSVANDCSNYDWEGHAGPNPIEGDTEHVLEWSMVRDFFTKLNSHTDFKDPFDSPNPESQDKLDFCHYWKESWDWKGTSGMPNPDTTAPGPVPGQPPFMQKPFEWFAEAYPFIEGSSPNARRAHDGEFIMFSEKALYDDKDMDQLIKRAKKKSTKKGIMPHEQPRAVIQRMRSVVGAYKYLTDKRVNTIFVDQVNRIGQQLERLEQALSRNPRIQSKRNPERIVQYAPWKYLSLEKKWYEYMDDVYKRADKKAQELMAVNMKRLKEEYTDAKMLKQSDVDKEKDKDKREALELEKNLREAMKVYIDKLEQEWSKTKDWPKPKWNT
ncbi:hypothetical protein DE146DRAFT_780973 [Phaeosphaeria sp. MPI-PUGE-AT-0046c]|nr:hypothetical protein DE146DRAFT_780973 [Phaeosphaeria sp. MPI-PUGE-AT-0046c]